MDILRKVKLHGREGDYILTLWDTHRTGEFGKSILGYRFTGPGKGKRQQTIFTGEDFHAPAFQAIDSDEVVRALLDFLTLRPGDTDDEYFEKYTKRQRDFAENEAEELQMYAIDDDPYPLEDVNGNGGKRRHKGYGIGVAGHHRHRPKKRGRKSVGVGSHHRRWPDVLPDTPTKKHRGGKRRHGNSAQRLIAAAEAFRTALR